VEDACLEQPLFVGVSELLKPTLRSQTVKSLRIPITIPETQAAYSFPITNL